MPYTKCLIPEKYFKRPVAPQTIHDWPVAPARHTGPDFNGSSVPRGIHSDSAVIANEFGAPGSVRRSRRCRVRAPAAAGLQFWRASPSDNTVIRVHAGLATNAPGSN